VFCANPDRTEFAAIDDQGRFLRLTDSGTNQFRLSRSNLPAKKGRKKPDSNQIPRNIYVPSATRRVYCHSHQEGRAGDALQFIGEMEVRIVLVLFLLLFQGQRFLHWWRGGIGKTS
jgi:hypothetical protein